jgi:putative serine protease PepD
MGIGVGAGTVLGHSGSTTPSSSTVIGAQSAPAVTISNNTASVQQDLENVAKVVEPSVVKITSDTARSEAVGSGDILTADGYIVTNDHVVQGFTNYSVTLSNGKTYSATLVGEDPQDDLAVIKINATGLTPIAFADSSKVTVGEFAIAVGNPLALQESTTLGTVSAVNGTASEAPSGPASELTGLIQTTAPIAPGNSGGALVNLQGQLIGIPTLEETNPDTRSASGIGYAIASNQVKSVATQLIQHGSVTSTGQGFIGIQAQDVTPSLAAADGLSVQSGVLVAGFANDAAGQSPAQQAGMQTGDVIIAVDGRPVNSSSDLTAALTSRAPGSKVTLTVVRGTSQGTVTVTLGERPTNTQG